MDVASLVTGLWYWLPLAYWFLHPGTNSGKLKVDSMIFGWAWSKMTEVFYFAIPHPDVFWYRLNSMGAQKNAPKKFLVTFSIYISCKNYVKYSWQILKIINLFKRHKYPSPNALNIKYFWKLSYNHWGFFCITKLPSP